LCTRYFTDFGIIGKREFAAENYKRFKGIFMSNRGKIPKPVVGILDTGFADLINYQRHFG
jgi:hypothetical protein